MDLTDIIYSNDYINILIQNYVAQSERYQMLFPESSALLTLNPQYSVLFLERSLLPENLFGAVPFTGLPKLFTPLSTLSLEVSGIVQTQNLYGGGYTGKNVIFGFLDTGIDYRHPAFLHANGQSRILAVWDQTDRTGTPPAQFPYGSLYTKSDLDAALESSDPLSLVPVTDPDGHGTYVAGVAGGTPDASAGFLGVAPEADFAVVKLKPAKQNLKDFYLVSSNAPVFEEDDLLSAMHFLNETAAAEGKPLVLCLALGTNQGSHSGTLPVSLTLARYGNTPGVIPVCATGNEGNAAHHYYGSVSETYTPKNVEFLVSEGNRGFLQKRETLHFSGCKFRIQSHNNGVLHFLRCRSRRRGSHQACCRSAPRSEKRGACRSGCPDSSRVPDRGRAVFLPQLRFHSESAWRRAGHLPRRREHWRTQDKNLSDSVWRVLI